MMRRELIASNIRNLAFCFRMTSCNASDVETNHCPSIHDSLSQPLKRLAMLLSCCCMICQVFSTVKCVCG